MSLRQFLTSVLTLVAIVQVHAAAAALAQRGIGTPVEQYRGRDPGLTVRGRDPGLTIDAPPAMQAMAQQISAIDQKGLARMLAGAGLELPPRIHVTLIPADDPRARQSPEWIVARAFGRRNIVIFPERVSTYPYDSLESVVRHEVAHLALTARAGDRPVPRWFHEGVAVSVDAGWSLADQGRLLLATMGEPLTADLGRLFESDSQPDTIRAYLMAAALVDDLRQRHGAAVPGAIAGRMAGGLSFAEAFRQETSETPDEAAMRAWTAYWRWTSWLPAATSTSAVWLTILTLSFLAFLVRMRQRMLRRRRWDEEEAAPDRRLT